MLWLNERFEYRVEPFLNEQQLRQWTWAASSKSCHSEFASFVHLHISERNSVAICVVCGWLVSIQDTTCK